MMSGERKVGFIVLLGEDFNCGEVRCEAGSLQFARLFGGIALGDEDKAVTRGEIFQSFLDAGKKLDLVLGDAVSEAENTLMLLVGDPAAGQVFEAVDQRSAEAAQTVPVSRNGGVFAVIEVLANLGGGMDPVVQVGDEVSNCPLEVDIVFPKGIVCVDQQRVTGISAGWPGEVHHKIIIGGSRETDPVPFRNSGVLS